MKTKLYTIAKEIIDIVQIDLHSVATHRITQYERHPVSRHDICIYKSILDSREMLAHASVDAEVIQASSSSSRFSRSLSDFGCCLGEWIMGKEGLSRYPKLSFILIPRDQGF